LKWELKLVIAENLGYLSQAEVRELGLASGEVSRLLHGLMQSLQEAA